MPIQPLDEAAISAALTTLPGWRREGLALAKEYDCKTFGAAAALLLRGLLLAEKQDHHPEIDMRYSKVVFRVTTHDAGGVSARDVRFAQSLDGVFNEAAGGSRAP
jgi:4a-hydroxytetrahydrobiopterin dehydratase